MNVHIDDIVLVSRLVTIEHGDGASSFLSQYIDRLSASGDENSVSLWRKIAAFWYLENGNKP